MPGNILYLIASLINVSEEKMTIGIIQIDEGKFISSRSSDGKLYRDWTKESFVKQYFDAIICVAKCNTLMIYDIALPSGIEQKNIVNTLQHELEYLLPLDLSEIVWGYQNNGENNFSIYVLRKEKITEISDLLKQSDLQCDNFYPVHDISDFDLAAFKKFSPVTMQVSKEIRPVRNKLSKAIYWSLLIAVVFLLITVYMGKYKVFSKANQQLSAVIAQNTKMFRTTQQELGKLSTEKELFDKIGNLKLNLQPILPVLQELSQMLPAHMWIINYVQHGEVIDITIESGKDEPNFFRHLSGAKSFKVISLRKSRGGNSTVIFYVKLKGGSK